MDTSGYVFEGLLARDAFTTFENSQTLASPSCGLKPIGTGKIAEQREGVREEPQHSTIQLTPRFARTLRLGTLQELVLKVE